jgi:DNA polymerase bacteriophage-type
VKLQIDFETRSPLDLRKVGVYRYATHPDTDIVCMAYAFDDEDVRLWVRRDDVPERIVEFVYRDGELRAWNAQFERLIWEHILGPRYGFPEPLDEQWWCTAAEAAAMALPRKLEDAAGVLRVEHQKDVEGYKLMLKMSKPKKGGGWHESPSDIARLAEYCMQDVRTERAVGKRLRRMSDSERRVYLLDQKINDRGVQLDVPLIEASQKLVAKATVEANKQLNEITDSAVTGVTKVADLTRWVKEQGLDIDNMRKDTVRESLKADLTERVRAVLELRADAGRSSVSKLKTMLACRTDDDKARGLLLYHGASTGRWSGKLIQPQNFARPDVKHAASFIPLILRGEYDLINMEQPVIKVIASLLREMITASHGCRLMAGDFASIEARVLAWIACQDDLVELFRAGGKIYERMAAAIYKVPIHEIINPSVERQIGKVTILGAGYQMGSDTFQEQTFKQTGIQLSDDEAENAIATYREQNAKIKQFWKDINDAAKGAVRSPGQVTSCGREGKIRYVVRDRFLWCVLPSGRALAYALPRLVTKVHHKYKKNPDTGVKEIVDSWTSEVIAYSGINTFTRKWGTCYAYGGMLTENVVQAMSRDLLVGAMLRSELAGYPNVLSVHDEVVADVPETHGSLEEFTSIMQRVPGWAEGLPVAVESWEGERYHK